MVTVECGDVSGRETHEMEMRRYYPCRVHLDGKTRFVAWYTADIDGFLRDSAGRLTIAATPEALGVPLVATDPIKYDFDRLRAWCASPDAAMIDCQDFLNAWNFLDDLSELQSGADTPYTRRSHICAWVYDKLFWGNNLPTVTPPGERFVPSWSPEELEAIRDAFDAGLDFVNAELAADSGQGQARANKKAN